MKRIILFCVIALGALNVCQSQEWMTSLDIAKRLALVQDKMIFMMWEDATREPYNVLVRDEKDAIVVDLMGNEKLNEIIWTYFVPVKVNEAMYDALFSEVKGKRGQRYIDKFNDDSIKIMDVNGTIINNELLYEAYLDFNTFIKKYALNTSFLKEELKNYRTQKSFYTTFRLASKYIDFGALVGPDVRLEIIKLSNWYLDQADDYLLKSDIENKVTFQQKSKLLRIKTLLILNKPKKALRQLKKINKSEVDKTNEPLVAFLNFTAHRLLKDESSASLWRSKVSLVNLKRAIQIVNINS